jgi:hypothetical protein
MVTLKNLNIFLILILLNCTTLNSYLKVILKVMLLSARVLKAVTDVNTFEATSQFEWTEGDTTVLYFNLIDSTLDMSQDGFDPAGRRYCPPATSTLTVVLESIDDARKLTRAATQPFPGDASIWSIQIFGTDKIRGTPQMRMTLVEPTRTIYGLLKNAIKIWPATNICK